MSFLRIPDQLWVVENYFSPDQFKSVRNMYRGSRMDLSMQYDNRVLSDWNRSTELQQLLRDQTERLSDIVQKRLFPQVAYVSLDLSGSHIMMHRLHPDIYLQCHVVMSDEPNTAMDMAFCTDHAINHDSEIDYEPCRRISVSDVETAPYHPNTAWVYLNEPRSFVGMLGSVPANSVREVLVLSYTRLY